MHLLIGDTVILKICLIGIKIIFSLKKCLVCTYLSVILYVISYDIFFGISHWSHNLVWSYWLFSCSMLWARMAWCSSSFSKVNGYFEFRVFLLLNQLSYQEPSLPYYLSLVEGRITPLRFLFYSYEKMYWHISCNILYIPKSYL